MFRPTASHALRSLIHPPLPLNARESQQLLNLLTTSFRQQLEKAHVISEDPSIAKTSSSVRRRRSSEPSGFRPTDTHMRTVLNNPLFKPVAGVRGDPTSQRDPMEVFEAAVAKGMMTIESAAGCLIAKKRAIVQSPIISVRDGMRGSGAGQKVLKWLLSSGTANDDRFLQSTVFSKILIEFMVAEGLQEYVWKWIQRAITERKAGGGANATASTAPTSYTASTALRLLILAESTGSKNLDAAIFSLDRAATLLRESHHLQRLEVLSRAGSYLVSQVTSISDARQPASELAFDTLVRLAPEFSRASSDTDLYTAHLRLHHPIYSNAELALNYLAARPTAELRGPRKDMHEKEVVRLGLDVAKFLLEKESGRSKDAAWVLEYLQTNFAKYLGEAVQTQVKQAKAEAASLQLLEGLNFA